MVQNTLLIPYWFCNENYSPNQWTNAKKRNYWEFELEIKLKHLACNKMHMSRWRVERKRARCTRSYSRKLSRFNNDYALRLRVRSFSCNPKEFPVPTWTFVQKINKKGVHFVTVRLPWSFGSWLKTNLCDLVCLFILFSIRLNQWSSLVHIHMHLALVQSGFKQRI